MFSRKFVNILKNGRGFLRLKIGEDPLIYFEKGSERVGGGDALKSVKIFLNCVKAVVSMADILCFPKKMGGFVS